MMKDINVSVETLYDSDKKISQFVDYINSLHSKIGDIKKIGTAFSNEPNALNLINDCVSRFANILEQAENLDIKFKTLKNDLLEIDPDFNLYYTYMSLSENGEIAIGSFDNFLDMSDDERQLYILKYYKEKYNELVGVYQDEIDILTILFRDFNKPNLSGYNIEGLHTDFHPYGYNVGGLYCNYHSISEGSSTESGYFYFYSPDEMYSTTGYEWWYKHFKLKEICQQNGDTEEEYLNLLNEIGYVGDREKYDDEFRDYIANVYAPMYNSYLYNYCRDYYASNGMLEKFESSYREQTFCTEILTTLKNEQTYIKEVLYYDTEQAITEYEFAVAHPLSDNSPIRESYSVENENFNGEDYEYYSEIIMNDINKFCSSDACKDSKIIRPYRTSSGGWGYRTPAEYKIYYNESSNRDDLPTPEEYEEEFYRLFHEYSECLYYFRLDDDGNVVDISYNQEQHAEDLADKSPYDSLYHIQIDGYWLTEEQYDKWYQYKVEYSDEIASQYLASIKDALNKQTAEVNVGKDIEAATRGDGTIDWLQVSCDGFEDGVINWAEGISNAFNADGTKTLGNYEQMYYLQHLTNSAGIYMEQIINEYKATHSDKEIEEFENNIYNVDGSINLSYLSSKMDSSQYQTLMTKMNNDKNGWNTFCYEMSSTAGNMAPSMAISLAVSFVPIPGARLVGSFLGQSAVGLSTFGNAKNEVYIKGFDQTTARFYGFLSAASEVGLGLFLGNIPGLNINAVPTLSGILKEGMEEFIQEYVSAALNYRLLGETISFNELNEQALKSFIYGSILSAGSNAVMSQIEPLLPDNVLKMNGVPVNFSNVNTLIELLIMLIKKNVSYTEVSKGIKGFVVPSGATSYTEIIQEVFPGAVICEADSAGNIVSMTMAGQSISVDTTSVNSNSSDVSSILSKLDTIDTIKVSNVSSVEDENFSLHGNTIDVASDSTHKVEINKVEINKNFSYQSMFGNDVKIENVIEVKTLKSFAGLTDSELNNLLTSQNSSYVEQKAAALTLYLKSIGLNFNNNNIKSIYNCLLCKLYNKEISIIEKNMVYELLGSISSLSTDFRTLNEIMSYDFPTRDFAYVNKIQKKHDKFNLDDFYSLRDGSAATIIMTEQQFVGIQTGMHDAGLKDILEAIYNIQRVPKPENRDIATNLLNSMIGYYNNVPECICMRLIADDYPMFIIDFPEKINTKQYQMFEAFVHKNASSLSEINNNFFGEDGALIIYGDDQKTSNLIDALEYAKTLIDDSVKLPDDQNIIGDTISDLTVNDDSVWVEDEDFGIEEGEYERKDGVLYSFVKEKTMSGAVSLSSTNPDIIQYNISDLQGSIDSVDSIYGKNFALKQLYDYIVSGQNPLVLPVTGNFRNIVTNLDYNILVDYYNTIVNSQSEVKTIKDEIFENMPDGLDHFSKARYLYLELNKRINYDTAFMFGDKETKNSIYNQDVTFDTLKGNKVVCKGWSELFRELLIDSGFSSDDVRVVGSYHKWVEIDCGDVIIRADATDNFKGTNDLAASKGGLATVGFLRLDKIYSGYNLNKKVQIKKDDGSTSMVKIYDTIDSGVLKDNARWLSNIDNYIGYINDGKYFNDALATVKDYFYSPTIVEKIFGVKPEKVYEAKVEKFINMELPANMDALDACNYFRQINKILFGDTVQIEINGFKYGNISKIGITPYTRILSDGTSTLATVIIFHGADADVNSSKICKIIDDNTGVTINSFDNLAQVDDYLKSIGYIKY